MRILDVLVILAGFGVGCDAVASRTSVEERTKIVEGFMLKRSITTEVQATLRVEQDLAKLMLEEKLNLQKQRDLINKVVKDYEEITTTEKEFASLEDDMADRLTKNPVHVFRMLKRFTHVYPTLERKLNNLQDQQRVKSAIEDALKCQPTPLVNSAHAYAVNIVRTQDLFHFDMIDMTKGIMGDLKTKAKMTAKDCIIFGKHCFSMNMWARSVEWFETAYKLAAQQDDTSTQEIAKKLLQEAAKQHDGRVVQGRTNLEDLFPQPLFKEPPSVQRPKVIEKVTKLVLSNLSVPVVSGTPGNEHMSYFAEDDDMVRYRMLCQDYDLRPLAYRAKFKCHLTYNKDPYYYLHPIKRENLHSKPDIALYHDLLSPKEIAMLRGMIPKLDQFYHPTASECIDSNLRSNVTKFLNTDLNVDLSNRYKWMTGLNHHNVYENGILEFEKGDDIAGYQYTPHIDSNQKHKNPDAMLYDQNGIYTGDIYASTLAYLSEGFVGGNTVFPRIGLYVKPVAGSLILWGGQIESGLADKTTLHAGCPVPFGLKDAISRFTPEGANLLRRPCKLTKY